MSIPKPIAKPFLKWAGGKRQLLAQFAPLFPPPARYRGYLEPFVGAGAVFFHLAPRRAVLGDVNRELIDCYEALRDDPASVIEHLRKRTGTAEEFYRVRALDPAAMLPAERAARMIFLNKTCFNGLYRVNRAGRFNVPFGRYARPSWCDAENLMAVSRALAKAVLIAGPFEEIAARARKDDFVYLDPPYHPLSSTSSFVSYTSGQFGADDQRRLAQVYRELDRKGCRVMLSNSDVDFVRDLYHGFDVRSVRASRAINSRADQRGAISEVVVLNYEPAGEADRGG